MKKLRNLTLGLIGAYSLGLGTSPANAEEAWQNALLENQSGEEYRFWTTEDGTGGYRRYGSWGGREGVWSTLGGGQYQLQPTMPATGQPKTVSIYQVGDVVVIDEEKKSHGEEYRILQKGDSWEDAATAMMNVKFGRPNFEVEVEFKKLAETSDRVSFSFKGQAKARKGFRLATWGELGLDNEITEVVKGAGGSALGGPLPLAHGEFPRFETTEKGDEVTMETEEGKKFYVAIEDRAKAAGFAIEGTGTAVRYGPSWTASVDVRSIGVETGSFHRYTWLDVNDPIVAEAKRKYIEKVRQKAGEKTRIPLIGSTWAATDERGKLIMKVSLSWEPEPLGPNGVFLQALAANNGAQLEANAKEVEGMERRTAERERRGFFGGRKVYGIVWEGGKTFPTVGFTTQENDRMLAYLMAEGGRWYRVRYGYTSKEVRVGDSIGPCKQEPLQGLGGIVTSPAPTPLSTPPPSVTQSEPPAGTPSSGYTPRSFNPADLQNKDILGKTPSAGSTLPTQDAGQSTIPNTSPMPSSAPATASSTASGTAPRFAAVMVGQDGSGTTVQIYDNRAQKWLDGIPYRLERAPALGEQITVEGVSAVYVGSQNMGAATTQPTQPAQTTQAAQPQNQPTQAAPQRQSQKPGDGAAQLHPDAIGRLDNVPKDSELRKTIIRALRVGIYGGNRRAAEQNPGNISFVFRHFIVDNGKGLAIVVIEDITGNLTNKGPMPMLVRLEKQRGRWIRTAEIPLRNIPQAVKDQAIQGGMPREFFEW